MVTDLSGSIVSISPSSPTVSVPPVLTDCADARCAAGITARSSNATADTIDQPVLTETTLLCPYRCSQMCVEVCRVSPVPGTGEQYVRRKRRYFFIQIDQKSATLATAGAIIPNGCSTHLRGRALVRAPAENLRKS